MSTTSEPASHPPEIRALPTRHGRRTRAAIDAAARTVIARKGILATTIADKEAIVRQWAVRFRDEANQRALYGKEV